MRKWIGRIRPVAIYGVVLVPHYDGNAATDNAFTIAFALNEPPLNISGWVYTGDSGNEQISGSDFAFQNRPYNDQPVTDYVFGHDTLNGSGGNDAIDGRGGNDSISGGDGSDTCTGNGDNDFVHGNSGNDRVFGGGGNDTLRGGQNDDVLSGDDGNDFLSGDAGNDALVGGTGADTFNFGLSFGADHITDFNRSQGDSVRIESGSYSTAQVGADTVVTMTDGSTLVLLNVNLSSLDSGWIHS